MPGGWLTAVRAAYGTVLLCAPARAAALAGGAPPDRRVRTVARVLGIRHLAQASVTAWCPCPAVLLLGAGTDVTHAASMLAIAARPRRRRAALTDAGAAAVFALAGLFVARAGRRMH